MRSCAPSGAETAAWGWRSGFWRRFNVFLERSQLFYVMRQRSTAYSRPSIRWEMFEAYFLAPSAKAIASSFFVNCSKVVLNWAFVGPTTSWWRLFPWNSCLFQSFYLFLERGETAAMLVLAIARFALLFAVQPCSVSSRASPCLIVLLSYFYTCLIMISSHRFWVSSGSRKSECLTLAGILGWTSASVVLWHLRVLLVCIRRHWFMT